MDRRAVFVNCPFDKSYEKLFVSLVGSILAVGLTPRCAIEIGENERSRLDKIRALIHDCGLSLHELTVPPGGPRLNMPFELGIACELSMSKPKDYAFGLLERTTHRHKKNLSDLGGKDAFAHNNTQDGMVLAVLSFANRKDAPIRFKDARDFVRRLQLKIQIVLSEERQKDVFNPHMYNLLLYHANLLLEPDGAG